jgi:hypothetical protein
MPLVSASVKKKSWSPPGYGTATAFRTSMTALLWSAEGVVGWAQLTKIVTARSGSTLRMTIAFRGRNDRDEHITHSKHPADQSKEFAHQSQTELAAHSGHAVFIGLACFMLSRK